MTYRTNKSKPCHVCGRPADILTGLGHICEECHKEGRTTPTKPINRCKGCAHAIGVMYASKHYFCQVVKNRQNTPKKIKLKDAACPKFETRTGDIPTVNAVK